MKLSILICTVDNRKKAFLALMMHLERQRKALGMVPVEILSECDDKTMPIGVKRQLLLERATGDYVAFIDDDDWVPDDYVKRILKGLEVKPDCVGFKIACFGMGKHACPKTIDAKLGRIIPAVASNHFADWADNVEGYIARTPYHKTPISTAIARKIGYREMRFGEDYDFSRRLKRSGLIKNEVFINEFMYHYRFTEEPTREKYGLDK